MSHPREALYIPEAQEIALLKDRIQYLVEEMHKVAELIEFLENQLMWRSRAPQFPVERVSEDVQALNDAFFQLFQREGISMERILSFRWQ